MILSVRVALFSLCAVSALGACSTRSLGSANVDFECWDLWDCNPDRDCGQMTVCSDGLCRPDLDPAVVECPYEECVVDEDCILATPYDCCNGCPKVATRDDLMNLPELSCYYEGGTEPGPVPPECAIDCTACPRCFPQPLSTRCDLGRCVAAAQGCSTEEATGLQEITTAALLTNPETYDGGLFRIRGTVLPGLPTCDDICPSPRCCQASLMLDGLVALTGSPCDLLLTFWSDDYCADVFETEGILPGGEYMVVGTLHMSPSGAYPWTMDVVGVEVAPPQALGGAYDVFVTEVISDASDPTCLPPILEEGDGGFVYLAEEGGLVRVAAPMLDCRWDFLGTANPEGVIALEAPVYCDGLCERTLAGEVLGEMVFLAFTSVDDQCVYEYRLSGQRLPAEPGQ